MTWVALVLSALAGLLHVGIWVAESYLWRRPKVWLRFGVVDQQAADAAVFFTFNQGFYNLFLAIGAIAGPVCVAAGARTVGWTLAVYACASMVGAALALAIGGGATYRRAATAQALLPTLALLASLVVALSS